MSDAIEQRVEQFVQEILGLIEQVSTEHRAAAMSAVTTALADAGAPRSSRPAAGSPARRTSPVSQGWPRAPRTATAPAAGSPSTSAIAVNAPTNGTAGPSSASAPPPASSTDGAATPGTPGAPASERETAVLDAVRALGRATAVEVAGRTGQPNGSVVVALRALVARGLVARAKTTGGVEYSAA